jgi:hypothetical protein
MIVFMMLIPFVVHPARADRATPYSALSVRDARFYHPTFRLDHRWEWLPTICRFGDGLVQMRLGGSGRTQINQMLSSMVGSDGGVIVSILLPFGSSLRVSIYR